MFIQRDYNRTKHDDFVLNVSPYMGEGDGAVEQYDTDGAVVGWMIKSLYE